VENSQILDSKPLLTPIPKPQAVSSKKLVRDQVVGDHLGQSEPHFELWEGEKSGLVSRSGSQPLGRLVVCDFDKPTFTAIPGAIHKLGVSHEKVPLEPETKKHCHGKDRLTPLTYGFQQATILNAQGDRLGVLSRFPFSVVRLRRDGHFHKRFPRRSSGRLLAGPGANVHFELQIIAYNFELAQKSKQG